MAAAHLKDHYDRLWSDPAAQRDPGRLASHRRRRSPRPAGPAVGGGQARARHQRTVGPGDPGRDRAAGAAAPGRTRGGGRRRTARHPAGDRARDGERGPRRWPPGPRGRGPERGRGDDRGRTGDRPAPVDIRHASKIDRVRVAGGRSTSSPAATTGGAPAVRAADWAGVAMRVLVTGASGMLGAGRRPALAGAATRSPCCNAGPPGGPPEVLADIADREAVPRRSQGRTPWSTWPPRWTITGALDGTTCGPTSGYRQGARGMPDGRRTPPGSGLVAVGRPPR